MTPQKIIALVGPTAVGKTALSIEIARAVGGEIISADSRQVYRGLDIGSGKITKEEMGGTPHHLIDVADPKDVYSASDFLRDGTNALTAISERGHVPLIVGGTGFYVDVLLKRISLAQVAPNEPLRKELERWNLTALQEKLQSIDPQRFETIDQENPRRLIRAIEIAEALGKNPEPTTESPYDVLWIGLTLPIETLSEKIKLRLDTRFAEGMLDEARSLHHKGVSYERMEALGLEYRAMARHLQGHTSEEEMHSELEKEIIAYAKRQMTWFKKNEDIHWFAPGENETILSLVRSFLAH